MYTINLEQEISSLITILNLETSLKLPLIKYKFLITLSQLKMNSKALSYDDEKELYTYINKSKNILQDNLNNYTDEIQDNLIINLNYLNKYIKHSINNSSKTILELRLYIKDELKHFFILLQNMLNSLYKSSKKNILNKYILNKNNFATQNLSFATNQMAYFSILKRDYLRLSNYKTRLNVFPFCKVQSNNFDSYFIAADLDFSNVSDNYLDETLDDDFLYEFFYIIEIHTNNLSKLVLDIIQIINQNNDIIKLPKSIYHKLNILSEELTSKSILSFEYIKSNSINLENILNSNLFNLILICKKTLTILIDALSKITFTQNSISTNNKKLFISPNNLTECIDNANKFIITFK